MSEEKGYSMHGADFSDPDKPTQPWQNHIESYYQNLFVKEMYGLTVGYVVGDNEKGITPANRGLFLFK